MKTDCGYLRNGIFIEPTAMDGKFKPCCLIKTFPDKKKFLSPNLSKEQNLKSSKKTMKDDLKY